MRDPASLDRYVGCLLGLEASEAYASTVYFDASKAQPIETGALISLYANLLTG